MINHSNGSNPYKSPEKTPTVHNAAQYSLVTVDHGWRSGPGYTRRRPAPGLELGPLKSQFGRDAVASQTYSHMVVS